MYAELQNGDIVELMGIISTTLPDGSTQELLYYINDYGVKIPLPYAHSPYKCIHDVRPEPRYRANGYDVPNYVEIWHKCFPIPRVNMREP